MRIAFTSLLICGSVMITAAISGGNAESLPPTDGSLRMIILSGRPVVDGVYLNGQGPFRFLVDTGAQTNQVDASIAKKIGLKPTFRIMIATVAGTARVPGGRVAELALGPAIASNQEFLFTGLEGIHQLSSGIEGVIGEEFLSHFDYLLDFAGRRITFGAVEPEGGSRTVLNRIDGRPALETDKGTLVLDSGTEIAILYTSSVERSGGRVATASGGTRVSQASDLKFRVAGHAYSILAAAVSGVSLQEDGVLPAAIFHSVYVSNSGRFLVLDPTVGSGR
jgi:hypothetical protein